MFQPELFSAQVAFDAKFGALQRIDLDGASWIDLQPGWVSGSDALFEQIVRGRSWRQRERVLFDKPVLEPRLTAPWLAQSGRPLEPRVLEEMRRALGKRYAVEFDSVGFNYYRDGNDSVAWHRDHLRREIPQPVVALVSLGEPRKFLLRPRQGGPSRPFMLGRGDLLVTGGRAQKEWHHSVPKVARAGPRISLAFRHGMVVGAYGD
jgi:alkylated DNA repair dioxygenase AlkB